MAPFVAQAIVIGDSFTKCLKGASVKNSEGNFAQLCPEINFSGVVAERRLKAIHVKKTDSEAPKPWNKSHSRYQLS